MLKKGKTPFIVALNKVGLTCPVPHTLRDNADI